jgi:predicted PurR-regulated permease PerM
VGNKDDSYTKAAIIYAVLCTGLTLTAIISIAVNWVQDGAGYLGLALVENGAAALVVLMILLFALTITSIVMIPLLWKEHRALVPHKNR